MTFISLIRWHAIGTFEHATKDDQAIQALATTLRAIWLRHSLLYITLVGLHVTVENVVCKCRWYKMVSGSGRPQFQYPGVIGLYQIMKVLASWTAEKM